VFNRDSQKNNSIRCARRFAVPGSVLGDVGWCSVAQETTAKESSSRASLKHFREIELRVYRVQDAFGRGPWKPGFSSQWTEDREPSEYLVLKPIQDEFPTLSLRLRHDRFYGVGCKSLEQLRRWITKSEYQKLVEFGYQCVSIDADKVVAQSEVQLVFERSKPLSNGCKPARLY